MVNLDSELSRLRERFKDARDAQNRVCIGALVRSVCFWVPVSKGSESDSILAFAELPTIARKILGAPKGDFEDVPGSAEYYGGDGISPFTGEPCGFIEVFYTPAFGSSAEDQCAFTNKYLNLARRASRVLVEADRDILPSEIADLLKNNSRHKDCWWSLVLYYLGLHKKDVLLTAEKLILKSKRADISPQSPALARIHATLARAKDWSVIYTEVDFDNPILGLTIDDDSYEVSISAIDLLRRNLAKNRATITRGNPGAKAKHSRAKIDQVVTLRETNGLTFGQIATKARLSNADVAQGIYRREKDRLNKT